VINVLEFYTLKDFLAEVRRNKAHTLRKLAEFIDITPQAVNIAFNGGERLVINHLSGWKRAFKFKRMEGTYFELLAILAGYSSMPADKRKRYTERALNIVQRMIESDVKEKHPNSLLYWLSPECAIMRNAVDMQGFPAKSDDIPAWVTERVDAYRVARGFSKAELTSRLRKVWKWLLKMELVSYSSKKKLWEKKTHGMISPVEIKGEIEDFQTAVLTLPHSDVHMDFARQLGGNAVLMDKIATFALPSKMHDMVRDICGSFFSRLVLNLNIACNAEEMARLQKDDPAKFKEISDQVVKLKRDGFEVPALSAADFDSIVQMVCSMRNLTAL